MDISFSNESGFITEVYLWVKYLGGNLKVVNEKSEIKISNIHIQDDLFGVIIDKEEFDLCSNSHLIRQFNWAFSYDIDCIPFPQLQDHLKAECLALTAYLDYFLYYTRGIGRIYNQNSNKLITLKVAAKVGLNVPQTLITTQRRNLIQFKEKHKRIITKSIQDNINARDQDSTYFNYTEELDDDAINLLPNSFFPSLFQELIEKSFEVRAFFIDSEWYSMAIFSQNDEQTKIDFRQYNSEKPNRFVPFRLPEKIIVKLTMLMEQLNYQTGSVDILCDTKGEFIFLEVNPVGQFGMTSLPCNYYLEKIIAEKFIGHEKLH